MNNYESNMRDYIERSIIFKRGWDAALRYEAFERMKRVVLEEPPLDFFIASEQAMYRVHRKIINNLLDNDIEIRPILQSCAHEFKLYTGLTETFNYCTKCNKKENE